MSDIFISYAHVDNQPVSGDEKGWITHFVNNLRNSVTRKMGRVENWAPWMDFRLKGADGVTPEIDKQLSQVHTLLIFLSPGWLQSSWCQSELEIFCRYHPDASGRIFVVEIDRLDKKDIPVVLHSLLCYRLWQQTDHDKVRQMGWPVPQAEHTAYFDRLLDLANDVASALKHLKQTLPAPSVKATVYVAPVDDALSDQREGLINELRQFGIASLPSQNRLDEQIEQHLTRCSHFVQLLDANYMLGIPCQQHAQARSNGKPVLQWRDPKLDPAGAQLHPEQKVLLEGPQVVATALPDFSRLVREAVLPKPKDDEPPSKSSGKHMVFVHAGPDDFDRAHYVAQQLQANGFGVALPRYQGDAAGIRKSIERGYQCCNVLLMLQQKATAEVVEDYLADAMTQTLKRETALHIMICQSEGAEELYFFPPNALTLTCKDQFETRCLEQFLVEVAA